MNKISTSLNVIKEVILVVDLHIAKKIDNFFSWKGYFNQDIIPTLAANIPFIVRVVFYLTLILLFLVPLKLVFPESRFRSFITYLVFILIILGVLGVFLGFFQLMYSF